ncbi:hypothetical protein [Pseudomonas hunanensis]|uniref:hypothetical protein n=1 Tax=Pseudomonas hunanensis TaxID=1247546 RepID=UPI0015BADC68|nr:hypothetical protein [Pseudomonas hunanensis]
MHFIHAASAFLLACLVGCGTTSVSPAITGNPGVQTGIGPDGYPTLLSLTVKRPRSAGAEARAACVKSQVNDIEGEPVVAGASVQASAKSSFYFAAVGMSKAFRYSLLISGENGSVYKFDRLHYINDGSQGGQIKASTYWSPEYVVQELESIADRVNDCISSS